MVLLNMHVPGEISNLASYVPQKSQNCFQSGPDSNHFTESVCTLFKSLTCPVLHSGCGQLTHKKYMRMEDVFCTSELKGHHYAVIKRCQTQ